MTPQQASKRFDVLGGKERERAQRRGVMRAANAAKPEAGRLFVSSGIGPALFKPINALQGRFIKIRTKQTPGTLTVTLEEKGIPALVETGGKTQAHIMPRSGAVGRFSFVSHGERLFRVGQINHPGGKAVGPKHFIQQGARILREAQREVDLALQQLADREFGK